MQTRNLNLWLDVLDRSIFTDQDHADYDNAHLWAEKLMSGGRLNVCDVLAIMALIDIATDYQPDE